MKKIMFSSLLVVTSIIHAGRVDITGFDKPTLLRALWREAQSNGKRHTFSEWKFLENNGKAEELIKAGMIHELTDRIMNIDISGDNVETDAYNQANGKGLAEKIIEMYRPLMSSGKHT